jgi:two-component system sensor histidine kinase VanS
MADPDKLSRVFNNLIKNAISYSKEKSDITINVNKKNDNVLIEVIKKGKQISEENINKIFEKFFRVDSSRGTKTGGCGLGLAIAKEIVELHNGKIAAESNKVETKFRVILPCN